jgi:PTS system ascorbate-specific IIC component
MKDVLDVLIDIASTPAILVAFIAVVGLLLQKKGIADIIRGGIKTFVGFLIVTAGANFVVSSLKPFGIMFQKAFHVTGVVPNNEAIVAVALEKFGTYTALIMLAGMLFNILFARITRYKYIYLTGHATLYMACMIVLDTIKAQGVPFFEKLEDNHSVKFGTANYQEELDKAITTLEEQVVKGGSHA